MAIPTSRTSEVAEILIHRDLCTGCGTYVDICSDFNLKLEDDKAAINDNPAFGCIGC